MKHCGRSKGTQRGVALVVVLILVSVALAAGVFFMQRSNSFLSVVGKKRRITDLELKAKSGIERAKADLKYMASGNGFTQATGIDGSTLSPQDRVDQGLIPSFGGARSVVSRIKFKSDDTKENYEVEVYYFPSDNNGALADYDAHYPKVYTIVSKATNRSSGEIFSIDAMLNINTVSGNRMFAYGITGDKAAVGGTKLPTGLSSFEMKPSIYDGGVYFGNFNPKDLKFGATYLNEGEVVATHDFEKSVSFMNVKDPSVNSEGAFIREPGVKLNFKDGKREGDQSVPDFASMLTSLRGSEYMASKGKSVPRTISALLSDKNLDGEFSSESDICLQYSVDASKKPKLGIYKCNTEDPRPIYRYQGQASDPANPWAEIDLSEDPEYKYLDCETRNCHIKGIVADDQLLMTDNNIVIEGDIAYYREGPDDGLNPRFQAVAGKNIIIPASVPFKDVIPDTYAPLDDQNNPISDGRNGVTNFIPPYDRDVDLFDSRPGIESGKSVYDEQYDIDPNGDGFKANSARALDLDGAFFAVGGSLKLEGIWEEEQSVKTPYTDGSWISTVDQKKQSELEPLAFYDQNNTKLVKVGDKYIPENSNEDMMGIVTIGIQTNSSFPNGRPKKFDMTRVAKVPSSVADGPDSYNKTLEYLASLKDENGIEPFYYYKKLENNGNIAWVRQRRKDAFPAFCAYAAANLSTCSVGKELPRQKAELLWVNGMLITKDYSWTQRNYNDQLTGFRRKVIHMDEQFNSEPPLGYVTSADSSVSNYSLSVIWQKSYLGISKLLKSQ